MDEPVQLVVFDLMGTLVRDEGVVARAYDRALEQAGLAPDGVEFAEARHRIVSLRGRPAFVVLEQILGDPARAEEATWAFDDHMLEQIESLQPVEGAGAVLAELIERGMRCAVKTSFGADVRSAVLSAMGWQNRFAAELSAHGVRRGHPAPDLLLEAILELGIDSVAQLALVGDTSADLEAGNRAGAGLVIGVLSGTQGRSQLETAPHTHLVASVVDVPAILDAPRTGGHRRRSDAG